MRGYRRRHLRPDGGQPIRKDRNQKLKDACKAEHPFALRPIPCPATAQEGKSGETQGKNATEFRLSVPTSHAGSDLGLPARPSCSPSLETRTGLPSIRCSKPSSRPLSARPSGSERDDVRSRTAMRDKCRHTSSGTMPRLASPDHEIPVVSDVVPHVKFATGRRVAVPTAHGPRHSFPAERAPRSCRFL
jgi:hypothetical protein